MNEVVPVQEKTHREIIKGMYFKDSTDAEFEAFMMLCNKTKLDPVAKQIYAVKTGNKINTIVSIDGYRLIAERTGRYVPGREPTYTYDEKGNLLSATCYVKKLAADGTWHEVGATALLSEYRKSTPIWNSMPHVMLAKCAESLALRRAFPNDLSGLYTEDEMGQAEVEVMKPETRLMRKPETIEVVEQPKLTQIPSTIDDLDTALCNAGFNIDKETQGDFVRILKDKHNAKQEKKVEEHDIIRNALMPAQFERFVQMLLDYKGPSVNDLPRV